MKQLIIAREKAINFGHKIRSDKSYEEIVDDFYSTIREYEKVIAKFVKPKTDKTMLKLRELGI